MQIETSTGLGTSTLNSRNSEGSRLTGVADTPEQRLNDVETMLVKYRPMVKIIVAKMRDKLPAHADLEELESVGLIGLINALERFDASRGYTFETYASIRVRGAILDQLRSMDMLPRSVRSKQRMMRKAVEKLEQKHGRAPTDEEIREELDLSPKKYARMKKSAAPVSMVFLDRANGEDEADPHEAIADEDAELCSDLLERKELSALVAEKIRDLPRMQQKVLAMYFFEEMRLAEIGAALGLSEARVSQIRTAALGQLRKFVNRMSY